MNRLESRELRVLGSRGSYVSSQTDVQAQAIFTGLRPVDDPSGWGYEKPERWGPCRSTVESIACLRREGSYADYYARFAAAVSVCAQPVPASEAVATLAVLDAARISAAEGQTVKI